MDHEFEMKIDWLIKPNSFSEDSQRDYEVSDTFNHLKVTYSLLYFQRQHATEVTHIYQSKLTIWAEKHFFLST